MSEYNDRALKMTDDQVAEMKADSVARTVAITGEDNPQHDGFVKLTEGLVDLLTAMRPTADEKKRATALATAHYLEEHPDKEMPEDAWLIYLGSVEGYARRVDIACTMTDVLVGMLQRGHVALIESLRSALPGNGQYKTMVQMGLDDHLRTDLYREAADEYARQANGATNSLGSMVSLLESLGGGEAFAVPASVLEALGIPVARAQG